MTLTIKLYEKAFILLNNSRHHSYLNYFLIECIVIILYKKIKYFLS